MAGTSYAVLEKIGRIRLSDNFFLREFLYSETAIAQGIANVPENLDLAVEVGTALCRELLEPLQARFGRIHVRSGYRSSTVNEAGNRLGFNCASNESNYANHIWDCRDGHGSAGATACIVIPAVADVLGTPGEWVQLAWWIHDHLPYASIQFFAKMLAFNLQWHERPQRTIYSYVGWHDEAGIWRNSGYLTKPGMANHGGDHGEHYRTLDEGFRR